jgi:hypothetical protein
MKNQLLFADLRRMVMNRCFGTVRKISLSKLAEQENANNIETHSVNHIFHLCKICFESSALFDTENLLKAFVDFCKLAKIEAELERFFFFNSICFVLEIKIW